MRRAIATACTFALAGAYVGCSRPTAVSGGGADATATPALTATAMATSPQPATAAALEAPPDAAAPAAESSVAEALEHGRLLTLVPVGRGGSFDATLSSPGGTGTIAARVDVAMINAPRAYRRALAFYRLGRALDSDVVPAVVVRPIGIGELGELLRGRTEARATLRARAVVQNDGTLDVMLRPPPPSAGREVALDGYEAITWARWAGSRAPVAGEDAVVLRSYVEALVLDYLSGNVLRRTAWLDERAPGLRLVESPLAFPLHTDAGALDRTLRQLREVTRFPRGLDVALRRLDRAAARALFCPGEFDTWLLPPRSLVELDERRAGLLTLVEARVAELGPDAVLSL